jgi:hypothetical protein
VHVELAEPTEPSALAAGAILLRFTIQNATSEPLLLADSFAEVNYRLAVRTASGDTVSQTRPEPPAVSQCVREVQPGEVLVCDYDLTKMCDALADGEYSIIGRRYVGKLDGEGMDEVESNTIAILVCADQASQQPPPSGGTVVSTAQTASGPRLVAARPILERHGFRVTWDAAKRVMTAKKDNLVATVGADKDVMVLAGQNIKLSKPARIVKGRLLAPGQALSVITGFGGTRVAEAPGGSSTP